VKNLLKDLRGRNLPKAKRRRAAGHETLELETAKPYPPYALRDSKGRTICPVFPNRFRFASAAPGIIRANDAIVPLGTARTRFQSPLRKVGGSDPSVLRASDPATPKASDALCFSR
jgi:hypothetical protein